LIAVTVGRKVDWALVLADVRRAGYTIAEVAEYTQIPRTTLLGYRNLGAEPRHAAGDVLIRFWAQVTERGVGDVPMTDVVPSAAEYRRM
jgi:hypothetical protein